MLYVFGKIGLNNPGRKEQKRAKKVGCQIPTDPDNRIILFTSFILRLEIILWAFDRRRWRSERLKSER